MWVTEVVLELVSYVGTVTNCGTVVAALPLMFVILSISIFRNADRSYFSSSSSSTLSLIKPINVSNAVCFSLISLFIFFISFFRGSIFFNFSFY